MNNSKKERVLLAMSGGVDSSVSALLLQEQGYEVVGIHFILDKNKKDFELVEKIANEIGIELIIEDISEKFRKDIIDYLIEEYSQNRTPNPCVKCNREIKFDLLKKFAVKHNCEKIATGHYAQIQEKEGHDGKKYFALEKAVDQTKDQTYYLHRLNQSDLEKIIFPLGEFEKSEIKKIAKEKKLSVDQKESQDICFISNNEKIEEFLKNNILNKVDSGKIVDEKGKILGEHNGLVYYTLGQRKGLDLSGGPYFVIGKNLDNNELIVSNNRNHSGLVSNEVHFEKVSWVHETPEEKKEYLVKIRYQGSGTKGKITRTGDQWTAILEESQWAPASGQSLVVYNEDEVIGGGVIRG